MLTLEIDKAIMILIKFKDLAVTRRVGETSSIQRESSQGWKGFQREFAEDRLRAEALITLQSE